jgi:phage terminase small subunit
VPALIGYCPRPLIAQPLEKGQGDGGILNALRQFKERVMPRGVYERPPWRGKYRDRVLTLQQEKMINVYFTNGFKMEDAYKRAGYAAASATNNATRVFKMPAVVREIERRQAVAQEKYDLDMKWVISRLMMLAGANFGDILVKLQDNDYDLSILTEAERFSISEISDEVEMTRSGAEIAKTKVKLESRIAALDKLARHLGLYNDKLEMTGEMSLVERLQAGRKRAGVPVEGVVTEPPESD